MEQFNSDLLPKAVGPYSHAIIYDGILYSSGQIPLTDKGVMVEGDIEVQTRQVLTNLKNLLEDKDGSLEDVIKVNIYLADMGDFAVVNAVYTEFFAEHKPARSTVEVAKLPLDAKVEMDIIAKLTNFH